MESIGLRTGYWFILKLRVSSNIGYDGETRRAEYNQKFIEPNRENKIEIIENSVDGKLKLYLQRWLLPLQPHQTNPTGDS